MFAKNKESENFGVVRSSLYGSKQWRIFHRSKVSIAYPAFMRKKRKDQIFVQILISNNNYCTTSCHILVFQSTITRLQPPSIRNRRAPLVLSKYPGISLVASCTRHPLAHAVSQWWLLDVILWIASTSRSNKHSFSLLRLNFSPFRNENYVYKIIFYV